MPEKPMNASEIKLAVTNAIGKPLKADGGVLKRTRSIALAATKSANTNPKPAQKP